MPAPRGWPPLTITTDRRTQDVAGTLRIGIDGHEVPEVNAPARDATACCGRWSG